MRRLKEAPIYAFLIACALLSVFTTVGIVIVLFEEAVAFFEEVPLLDFLTGTEWFPLIGEGAFGVLPLLNATLMIAFLSMLVAVPVGLLAAIYLSEYAHPRVRAVIKPVLEVLAGIPTVVYGYFALTFITPDVLQALFGSEVGNPFNALSAAIAIGILQLPLVASLSEDAMRAVPAALREGAYGLGANRFEVATRVVVPAALSGVVAAVILAASRAAGETMIVTLAAGGQPNLSWNPFEGMQAMTAYIVAVSLGDTPRGTIEYSTIFAVGSLLFMTTLVLNVFAQWLLSRFREAYE
jgi:phosphate transport system permease protein